MNGGAWISLIALTGWLVLAAASYRAHRVGAGTTMVMALAWIGIFLVVVGLFVVFGG